MSIIFFQSSWCFWTMASSWISNFGRISAWLDENCRFFINSTFLCQSYFYCSYLSFCQVFLISKNSIHREELVGTGVATTVWILKKSFLLLNYCFWSIRRDFWDQNEKWVYAILYKNLLDLRLFSCGLYKHRIRLPMATALPSSYPTPREGWVTSATITNERERGNCK